MTDFPSQARAVVIGGGIVGASVAYHLAKLGWRDTVLVERHKLTSGSTHHAAGLVGQLRASANITQLLRQSVEVYERLEAETGLATGWQKRGGLRLACTEDRLIELRRQATTARSFGLDMHMLSPAEAKALWPAMAVDDVIGAAFLPTDGQANPSDITQALAKGARMNGARLIEDCAVMGFLLDNGRVAGVVTDHGVIRAEVVVNCAGQWARAVGALAGVNVPLVSVQHQYLISEPIPGLPRNLPTLRDPDRLTYFKEEVGGLAMGGYEPDPRPWAEAGVPENFAFTLLNPDWDHFEPMMKAAIARVPALETAGIKTLINGPESFTPDGNFILGEAPELPGFFVAAGFNAFGIASGGGAGKALAEWIIGGEAPYDLWPVDIRRFGPSHKDEEWVRARTLEAYAKHYAVAYPHDEYKSARPTRVSPLYPILASRGAVFGEKLGWERPNWFAKAGETAEDKPSFAKPNWFEAVAREHRATREAVALFDQSSFAKFLLFGRDAPAVLDLIAAGDMLKPPGSVVYTQLLNHKGGIEADLTAARIGTAAYYLVTGTGFATRDYAWIASLIPPRAEATLVDVTSASAVFALMGPRSREVLAAAAPRADLSDAAFPFLAVRELAIAGAPLWALRVTYVGELGYELHIPTESAAAVYRRLHQVGAALGLIDGGYRAIESLRLEKGYRAWGADIGPDYSPREAGLMFAVKMKSGRDFIGRKALEAAKDRPLTKRLAGFLVDEPGVFLHGRETILRDGQRVGWLASGGHGHTIGAAIGYGYVRNEAGIDEAYLASGRWELEVAAKRVPSRPFLRPPYDPEGRRLRG